jgi:hypothetical protein
MLKVSISLRYKTYMTAKKCLKKLILMSLLLMKRKMMMRLTMNKTKMVKRIKIRVRKENKL